LWPNIEHVAKIKQINPLAYHASQSGHMLIAKKRDHAFAAAQEKRAVAMFRTGSDRRDKRREALGNLTSASSTAST
jgi:hypothetical protein